MEIDTRGKPKQICGWQANVTNYPDGYACAAHLHEKVHFRCPYGLENLKIDDSGGIVCSGNSKELDSVCKDFEPMREEEKDLRRRIGLLGEKRILEKLLGIKGLVLDNADTLRERYGLDYLAVSESIIIDHSKNEFEVLQRTKPAAGKTVLYGTIDQLADLKTIEAMEKRMKEIVKNIGRY